MLTALLHGGVGEIVAVCARWFGGTKLGTGGLARAYSSGVTLALASLPVTLVRIESHVEIELSYPHVDGLRQALDELDAEVVAEDYGVRVRYRVAVPSSRLERLRSRLADLTRGDGVMRDASDS
jgi:putative IMPACT (imprinted ancient) family translation regulator